MNPRITHRLQLLAAAALFSTGGAAIKAATLSMWQVASFRSGIAMLAVLLLVPAARKGWSWHVWLASVPYALTMILFVSATKLTTAANAIFLQSAAPVYVLLLGPWLLRERIHREDLYFMGAMAVGLGLFFLGAEAPQATAPDPLTGNLLAILSGICWAFTVVGLRWIESSKARSGSALATVVAGNAIAFALTLPLAIPVTDFTLQDGLTIGYLGIFQIALAYGLVTAAIRHVPAMETATVLLVEPALNPVWAWLVHEETPGIWAVAGGGIILAATLIKTWWGARPPVHARRGSEAAPG